MNKEGKPLVVSASIGHQYSKAIKTLMRQMHKEIMAGVDNCYKAYAQDADGDLPEKGSLISQIRILLNLLSKKYQKAFSYIARTAVNKMVGRIVKHSEKTLNMSLKEISKDFSVKPDYLSPDMQEIIKAATIEATEKIKLIPQNHIAKVQSALMDSKMTGNFGDFKKVLVKCYQGDERRAELTAMDQTRKINQSLQLHRFKTLGIKKFKWLHTGGGRDHRELHKKLSGQVFSVDDPPYIGDMYGQRVYGFPAQLPNCRCKMTPVLEFDKS